MWSPTWGVPSNYRPPTLSHVTCKSETPWTSSSKRLIPKKTNLFYAREVTPWWAIYMQKQNISLKSCTTCMSIHINYTLIPPLLYPFTPNTPLSLSPGHCVCRVSLYWWGVQGSTVWCQFPAIRVFKNKLSPIPIFPLKLGDVCGGVKFHPK